MADESRKTHRRFRFSLRGLLCFTVLAATAFAWINYEVAEARVRRQAVEGLLAGGGGVSYADASGETIRGVAKQGDPFPSNWLTRILGENPQLKIRSAVVGNVQQSRRGLSRQQADGDHNLQFIPRLQGIEYLDARGESVTNLGLRHLRDVKTLVTLTLSGSVVSDTGLEQLTHLQELRILILADTLVTDAGMASVAQLANLRTLNLAGTDVTNAAMTELKSLSRLRRLILAGTRISAQPAEDLAALPLRRLSLASTNAGDAWMPVLARMETLIEIDLHDTNVTDAGLRQLSELPNLETLIIGRPEFVTAEGIAAFQRLRPDVQVR